MNCSTRNRSALIHFDGPWPDGERKLMKEAAEEVEATRPSHDLGPESPWVMIRSETEPRRTYLASRLQVEGIFREESAEGLASQLRTLASE